MSSGQPHRDVREEWVQATGTASAKALRHLEQQRGPGVRAVHSEARVPSGRRVKRQSSQVFLLSAY